MGRYEYAPSSTNNPPKSVIQGYVYTCNQFSILQDCLHLIRTWNQQKDWQSSNKSSLEVSSVDEWDQTKAKGWHEAGGVVHLERRIKQEWPFSKPLTLPGPQSLLKLISSFIITIKEWISCPCSGTLLFNVTCRHITIHSSPFNPHSGIVQWLFNDQIRPSWPA